MSWLAELLLESPVPPSNYLPDRRTRLGMGRATLRRGTRPRKLGPSYRLRDLGSAHPLIGGTRVVPAEMIAAELEEDIRSVNPPVTQGWMVGALALAAVCMFAGLQHVASARDALDAAAGVALMVLPLAAAFVTMALASAAISGVELRGDRVIVRSWLAARLGRPGRDLGPAEALHAELEGHTLTLSGRCGQATLSLRAWPPSARRDAVDELPIWGVDTPFGAQPSRRAERDRRHEQALERRRAEEEAHRHRH